LIFYGLSNEASTIPCIYHQLEKCLGRIWKGAGNTNDTTQTDSDLIRLRLSLRYLTSDLSRCVGLTSSALHYLLLVKCRVYEGEDVSSFHLFKSCKFIGPRVQL